MARFPSWRCYGLFFNSPVISYVKGGEIVWLSTIVVPHGTAWGRQILFDRRGAIAWMEFDSKATLLIQPLTWPMRPDTAMPRA